MSPCEAMMRPFWKYLTEVAKIRGNDQSFVPKLNRSFAGKKKTQSKTEYNIKLNIKCNFNIIITI